MPFGDIRPRRWLQSCIAGYACPGLLDEDGGGVVADPDVGHDAAMLLTMLMLMTGKVGCWMLVQMLLIRMLILTLTLLLRQRNIL